MTNSLNEVFLTSTSKYSDNPAIIYQDTIIKYKELELKIQRFSTFLGAKGLKKGDKVATIMGNCPEFIIAYFAILQRGAVVVPINPMYSENEFQYILENSHAKLVILNRELSSKLSTIMNTLPSLETTIYEDEVEKLSTLHTENVSLPLVSEHDLAVILYTSGTTGKPKGAMLTHGNLASNASSVVSLTNMTEKDKVVAVVPIFHVLCMTVCMITPLSVGGTVILTPKFSPAGVADSIFHNKATVFVGVPTMYSYFLQLPNHADEKFASLRACFSGGAPMPVEVLQQFEQRFNLPLAEGYGLSESSAVTAVNPLDGKRKPGSVGVSIPNVQNKIVDAEGAEVPRGEVGELIVKGPNVMMGYLGMPAETSATIKDGWLYTGDLAKMDEEGYIFIVDRKKDMLLVGGYNVYPREVEEVLYEHPDIVEAAVIGIPHPDLGESVKAYIVTSSSSLTEQDVIDYCNKKLVKYKNPREVKFLSELPKNTTGKILRRSLKEMQPKV